LLSLPGLFRTQAIDEWSEAQSRRIFSCSLIIGLGFDLSSSLDLWGVET
jgi:hypothetical protein